MNSNCISIKNLICNVSGRTILSIDGLNINHGERIAIVGHNGAGKSTFIKLLTGFLPSNAEKFHVLNYNLKTGLSTQKLRLLRREIGQVLQGLDLVNRLSVLDNVLIGSLGRVEGWRSTLGLFPDTEINLALEVIDKVGLKEHSFTRVDKLSGGERQRIAIGRMLMQKPKIIIADEPTSALDPVAAIDMCNLIKKSTTEATIITIIHNTTLLPYLADRVLGFKSGKIIFDLPLEDLKNDKLNHLYEK